MPFLVLQYNIVVVAAGRPLPLFHHLRLDELPSLINSIHLLFHL